MARWTFRHPKLTNCLLGADNRTFHLYDLLVCNSTLAGGTPAGLFVCPDAHFIRGFASSVSRRKFHSVAYNSGKDCNGGYPMKKPIVFEPLLALCALVVLLFMTVASFAQQSTPPQRPRQACAADYQKFCSEAQAGQGRVAQCMRDHASGLSDPCKASLAAAKEQRAEKKSSTVQPAQ